MKTIEKIYHDVQDFSESLALEVLHFIEFLKHKKPSSSNDLVGKGVRNVINVKDYGATGDGVTDDSPAIQKAINAASGTGYGSISVDVPTGTGSATSIFLPSGVYRLGTQLSIGAYTTISGDRAILNPDAGVSAMQISGYQISISNLVFIGGSNGINIVTNNVSSCVVNIEHCEFQVQTSTAIESDTNSASTLVNISGCKFHHTDVAVTTIKIGSADRFHIRDSWATVAGVFAEVVNGVLEVSGLLGVPTNTPPWFINHGALHLHDSRFGGELLKQCLVENHSTAQVVIRDCDVYTSHIAKFHQLPETFIYADNSGMTAVRRSFWFAPDITDTELAKVNDQVYLWDVHGNRQNFTHQYEGNSEAIARVMMLGKSSVLKSSNLEISRKLLQIPYGSGGYGLDTNGLRRAYNGIAFVEDMFGAAGDAEYMTSDSSSYDDFALHYVQYNDALADLPDGYITVVYNVFVLGNTPIQVETVVANNQQGHTVSAGANVLCCHGYKAGTKSNRIRLGVSGFNNTQYFAHTSTRIFSGIVNIDTLNTIVYGDAPPIYGDDSAFLWWEAGDRVIKRLPEVGQPKSWICTVRGKPGTWVSEGTL